MSVSLQRSRLVRALDVFVATAMLMSSACHQAQSSAPHPKAVERSEDQRGIPRFAGVDIVPSAGAGFLIRVHSQMVGGGEPLYVIDGAPMRISPTRGIDWFTPEQIADIKVLKSPHELAEYGPNGVNGVIVVTTKHAPVRP